MVIRKQVTWNCFDFNAAILSLLEYIDNEDSVSILLNLKAVSLMLFVNY